MTALCFDLCSDLSPARPVSPRLVDVRSLAILSMHTSPFIQPGAGDSGGMNVYIRELSSRLARSGMECEVYTRAWSESLPATIVVEPGLRVHHVPAGPLAPVAKRELPGFVDEFTEGVLTLIDVGVGNGTLMPPEVVHANYWLSGLAGHVIKHEMGIPLVSTFHTLARVKAMSLQPGAGASGSGSALREGAEDLIASCSDAVLASCDVEADQLVSLCGVDASRVAVVTPGVDHAFFSPGYRPQARSALGMNFDGPMLLFVGRIEPLKGADIAVRSMSLLRGFPSAKLVIVGGPSGPDGDAEMLRIRALVTRLGIEDRVVFVPPQSHELLSTYYRAADVCLVPSHTESFGLVALEAAACGTPVIATAVGGLQTLVDDGRTGFLVDVFEYGARTAGAQLRMRSPEALAHDIASRAQVLFSDPLLSAQMANDAALRAREYSWSAAASRLSATYRSVSSERLIECG